MQIRDLGPEFHLLTDCREIAVVLDHIGRASELYDWGCLFVRQQDGDYTSVFGCWESVPRLGYTVVQLFPNDLPRD